MTSARTRIRVIITGTTGMVGEGVLHECLKHPDVDQVLVINRKACGVSHPKLVEILHSNYFDISSIEPQLENYNACFFCLGVSSVGMKEEEYNRVTHDLTMHVANLLSRLNPDMVFCYVSGEGTDSTEQGRSMWARIKGKTENNILRLPFKRAYMFRPGYIHPTKGLMNTHKYYRALSWLYPVLGRLFPNHTITLKELGTAMIHTVNTDYYKSTLENNDISKLAET